MSITDTTPATFVVYGVYAGDPMLLFINDFEEAENFVKSLQSTDYTNLTIAYITGINWSVIDSARSVWDIYREESKEEP